MGHVQGPVPHLRQLVAWWQYDSNSSGDRSEGEVGNEEEDGAQLASVHYSRAAADVQQTDALSALMLNVRHSVLPSPCLS